jgi:hypothetical protein
MRNEVFGISGMAPHSGSRVLQMNSSTDKHSQKVQPATKELKGSVTVFFHFIHLLLIFFMKKCRKIYLFSYTTAQQISGTPADHLCNVTDALSLQHICNHRLSPLKPDFQRRRTLDSKSTRSRTQKTAYRSKPIRYSEVRRSQVTLQCGRLSF